MLQGDGSPLLSSFDPSENGTPETRWSDFLSSREEWAPKRGGLVVVSPHPDDELLGAGGLIRDTAMAGEAVTIVSVTDGEAAYPQGGVLGSVRRLELTTALRKLCLFHINIVRVGIPDGRVSRHINRLRNAVLAVLRPSATLIAPFEQDGHPDHEATGRVCCELARSQKLALARYPIWAWHQQEPKTLSRLRWGKFSMPSDTQRAKARALQCFDSQLRPRGLPAILPPQVLEYFHRPYEAFVL